MVQFAPSLSLSRGEKDRAKEVLAQPRFSH